MSARKYKNTGVMIDWYSYWNSGSIIQERDFLRQVGKTVNGQPITPSNIDVIVDNIVEQLKLSREDRVLDLCCGNGLITNRCSLHCQHIIGVDFSKPLIRIASTHFGGKNIRYVEADVSHLPDWLFDEPFTKIYMYEGLQHIGVVGTKSLLLNLRNSAVRAAPIFLGSVPDRACLWNFYNTRARRDEYYRRIEEGTEPIGHWWNKSALARLCHACGYKVKFTPSNPLHVSHYRFDALCHPDGGYRAGMQF